MVNDEQKEFKQKIMIKRKFTNLTDEQKENYMKHRKDYENTREPLIIGLASDFDLELFRQAQARAVEDLV